jgi:hypothetical protein
MGRRIVRSMMALFGSSELRSRMDLLMFNEGIKEIDNQLMKWKSLGVIMRAVFIP